MMNRNSSNCSFIGVAGRNLHTNGIHNAPITGLVSHRRRMSLTAEDFSNDISNYLDLFSGNGRALSVASSDESNLKVRLERLLAGSTKPGKSMLDDLLSSNEGGTHDYDWLLTPPETPILPSSNGKEFQPKSVAPTRHSSVRSGSTNRTSRLSVSQSESNNLSRPARSGSVTRSSISTTQNKNRNSNILNTSSASVSSYIRPSTPTKRSPSAARPSTASSHTTPSRSHPSSTTTSTSFDRTIRPSSPTPRPQSPITRPASRPSTPTHSNRSVGPTSRPNSPVSRVRAPSQPISLPYFPNETPPNLRTSVPERLMSAGRSRSGVAMTVKGNVENTNTKRQSSPVVTRGRLAEPPGRGRLHGNGHVVESVTRKPIKVLNSENGTGFGRSISKKSLDMAIKHMDIRTAGTRPLSGSTLFPHSIRSSHGSSAGNNVNSKNGNFRNGYSENKVKPISVEHNNSYSSKVTQVDVYESLRYDAILLKEDLKNTSWLHSADEKNDENLLFDNGFESLPEPFTPL